MTKYLLNLFAQDKPPKRPPIWLMRQAGRYLPEYQKIRQQAGGFLDLCLNPELAEEVSLQPIRRYGFDAAIVFADILLIPYALGQKLWFVEGEGPRLEPIDDIATLDTNNAIARLAPVMETLTRLKSSLPADTSLIGFAGAPWTVATYMIAGRGTGDHAPAKLLAQNNPQAFQAMIDLLVAITIDYLQAQVKAGAEVLQLFDSWAGALRGAAFEQWCIAPMAAIIAGLRARNITTPIIAFPRAMHHAPDDYVKRTRCDVLSLDSSANRQAMINALGTNTILQGNLDPNILVAGGQKLDAAIDAILQDFAQRRFIFNLGHGILPTTPPSHIAHLVARIRNIG